MRCELWERYLKPNGLECLFGGGIVMVVLKKLEKFTIENEKSFGFNGFVTDEIYEVVKTEKELGITLDIKYKRLDYTFVKEWPHKESNVEWYNDLLIQGYSYGAYINNELVGIVICEKRNWNNTLWIADIIISDKYRRQGIGNLLLDKINEIAKLNDIRIIGLETQSCNMPAILFYKKNGFTIEGIDVSLYTNDDVMNQEVALYMKKRIQVY